jgi:rod shape-determining protein MreC
VVHFTYYNSTYFFVATEAKNRYKKILISLIINNNNEHAMFQSRFSLLWRAMHTWFIGQKSSFISIIFVACLAFLGKASPNTIDQGRSIFLNNLEPILEFLTDTASKVRYGINFMNRMWDMNTELNRLKQQNQTLQQWQIIARKLERENSALRILSNMPLDSKISSLTARLMTTAHPLQSGTVLLNVGSQNGVVEGAVLTNGLGNVIGRIQSVSDTLSRVLLVTDLNSRIPVMVERTGGRGILSGQQLAAPILEFVKEPSELKEGDSLITVPDGGFMVPNLPIGSIKKIMPHRIEIELSSQIDNVDYVRVLYTRVERGKTISQP